MVKIRYYKLIRDNSVIGICSSADFRIYQHRHKTLLVCDEMAGQYVQIGEVLYRDNWMQPITDNTIDYEEIAAYQIDKEEYSLLKGEEGGAENTEIIENVEYNDESSVIKDPIDTATVEYAKELKISEMSRQCNRIITTGVDVELSDNKVYHFSLTTQDQLNFISLSSMIANGETQIPYHADGELCKFYSVSDISKVIEAATVFKTYHITYFNALRNYIQSLETIEDVANIEYGVSIPEQYQSEVLISLIANKQNDGGSVLPHHVQQ